MLSERSERRSSNLPTTGELRSRKHPDYLLRASWFDYKSPAVILVIFSKKPETPALSVVIGHISEGRPNATVRLSHIGEIIEKSIHQLPLIFEHLQIITHTIMPDHVHIVMQFTSHTQYTLGRVVAKVKGLVSAEIGKPIWSKGFNDKISFKRERTEEFIKYTNENPLRYFIRRSHPEFFTRKYFIRIAEKQYEIFGNPALLRHPVRSAVRFSRRYSPSELSRKEELWEETIRQSGVLISPFIHPIERQFRDRAIDLGASLIIIQDNGFPERFKPGGKYFELCSEGRLLIIAPKEHQTRTAALSRQQCLEMNQLAYSLEGSVYQRE